MILVFFIDDEDLLETRCPNENEYVMNVIPMISTGMGIGIG
jgi:hypothetical protein